MEIGCFGITSGEDFSFTGVSDFNGYFAFPAAGRGVCTQLRRLSAGPWVRGSRKGARSLGGSPKVLNQQTCQLSPQSGRNISPTHFNCSLLSLLWSLLIISNVCVVLCVILWIDMFVSR